MINQEIKKALCILRGCGQTKDIERALNIYDKLRENNIKINADIYNELLRVCLVCNEIEICSYIFKEAYKEKIEIDNIFLDKYLELYSYNINSPEIKYNDINNVVNNYNYQINYNINYYKHVDR